MRDGVTDKVKELYDDITFGYLSYDRARHNPLLFRFLGMIKPGERVFDIGCGAGYWMQVYVDYGVPKDCIVGVDISPTNVANLRKQGFHAEWGNVLELQLEDGVSDFTVCNGVIHHTNDPFRAFEELARITRPGGYIWLQVYNQWNPYYYIVHRTAYPLRYFYWNCNKKKVADVVYPLVKIFFQPLSLLLLGRFLDEKSGRALFMDQVMTPRAYVFSKKKVTAYAEKCGCHVETIVYANAWFTVDAIIRKGGSSGKGGPGGMTESGGVRDG